MMRRPALFLTVLALFVLSSILIFAETELPVEQPSQQPKTSGTSDALSYASDRVLIKFRNEPWPGRDTHDASQTSTPSLNRLMTEYKVQSAKHLFPSAEPTGTPKIAGLETIYLLQLAPGSDVAQAVQSFAGDPNVEWAEPDYLAFPAVTTPNDPLFPEQWGLAKIQAPAAWNTTTGSATVPVAIIDSGIDFSHLDLAGKLWVNPGEIAGNGIDDDNNGYVDDVNGWDLVNDDNDPADDHGHGTQVAGIAAAATDNSVGIAGTCWGCKIMPVKVMQASGSANYSDIAAGVLYAAQKGARVINLSLGAYSYSFALHAASQAATNTYDALVVASAGNDSLSNPFYPAAYPEVLAVAGTTQIDTKAPASNFGTWVDVVAPAVSITTTLSGGDWGSVTGTSYATAFVSGVAGLIRSQQPTWSQALINAQILHTADPIDALNPGYAGLLGSGRLNASSAVTEAPHPVLTIVATTVNGDPQGKPAPGERSSVIVTLGNKWLDAEGVTGTLTTSDPDVTISQGNASFDTILAGETNASSPPFTFTVATNAGYNHAITFNLHVTANGGAYVADLPISIVTQSGDEIVSGTITADETWTNDKRYIVTSNVGVAPGVTLTIEPGTEVRFDGNYSLNVGGTLIADGTAGEPIRLVSHNGAEWAWIRFDDSTADAVVDHGYGYASGSILRHVGVEKATGIDCNNATPYLAHLSLDTTVGITSTPGTLTLAGQPLTQTALVLDSEIEVEPMMGGIIIEGGAHLVRNTVASGGMVVVGDGSLVFSNTVDGWIYTQDGSVVRSNSASKIQSLTDSQILSNTVRGDGIVAGNGSQVRDNNVETSSTWAIDTSGVVTTTGNRLVGGGIRAAGGIVQGNLIANSGGIGLEINGSTSVISNTIAGSAGTAIMILSGESLQIRNNNLEGNKGQYDIVNQIPQATVASIPAHDNWWGTTDSNVIDQRIFDFYDDYIFGIVQYSPVLSEPVQSAPAYVRSVTLTPESPVGIETVTFDVLYSQAMDHKSDSELSFMTPSSAWTTRDSMPTARSGLGVAVASNGRIYAIGGVGYDASGAIVEEYDPATDTWTTRTSMPTPRSYLGVATASNGKIYAIGGHDGGALGLTTVEEYDPATDTWTAKASMSTARFFLGVAVARNGKIYAIGGRGPTVWSGQLATVEEYDPATDTWTTRASMPTPREGLGVAAASNGRIYAIGGGTSTVQEYNPATDTWTTRASMPTARSHLGVATASNGKIYAIGGYDGNNPTATVQEYNPATDTWTTRPSMPTARSDLGLVASNGRIYAIGGLDNSHLATVEEMLTVIDSSSFYGNQWLSPWQYRAYYDINSLVPRSVYSLTVQGAVGADGIEIAPTVGCTFTVDYAGAAGDTTPPPVPAVEACASTNSDTLSASWSAYDPDSAITLYRYAIGTTSGGTDVINWTETSEPSLLRSGLSLIPGQTYYIAVKARNEGGLWSVAGIPGGLVAGSGACTTNKRSFYLPLVLRGY
jgi:subtilisin family serine protease/N-acetylneuraminic acid mutarotase